MQQTDVSNLEKVQKLKGDVESILGHVDILINNAGIMFGKEISEEKPENIEKMINVNLLSDVWVKSLTFRNGLIVTVPTFTDGTHFP